MRSTTGLRYADNEMEITRHGSSATIHDRTTDRYFHCDYDALASHDIAWEPYVAHVPKTATVGFFVSFAVLLALGLAWFIDAKTRPLQGRDMLAVVAWLVVNIVLHEASHVAALRLYGRKPDRIGFKLNYKVFPAFYVRMDQILLLAPSERVVCHLAGIWSNLIATAAGFAFNTLAGGGVPLPALHAVFAMMLVNLVPLVNTDGQKVLTTIMGLPETKRLRDMRWQLVLIRALSILFLIAIIANAAWRLTNWGAHE